MSRNIAIIDISDKAMGKRYEGYQESGRVMDGDV
jgi:hypothetical protein